MTWSRLASFGLALGILDEGGAHNVTQYVDHRAPHVEQAIRQGADERLVAVEIFDIYRGEPIPVGYKSMAYRLTYQSQQRGLNEKEVTQLRGRIIKTVEMVTGGKLRG